MGSPKLENVLIGGRGHDRLFGVSGKNTLNGGWGVDAAVFYAGGLDNVLNDIEHEDHR